MPTSVPPDSTNPAEWLRYARADLALAEAPPPAGVFLELLAYHAQQAAEKALKAVLLHATRETPPRTHDVVLLLDLCGEAARERPPVGAEAAQRLTEYAVLSRYPSDLGEIDEPEWRQAAASARAVVAWAATIIEGEGGR